MYLTNRYKASHCNLCGQTIAQGAQFWYERGAERGKRSVCLTCHGSSPATEPVQEKIAPAASLPAPAVNPETTLTEAIRAIAGQSLNREAVEAIVAEKVQDAVLDAMAALETVLGKTVTVEVTANGQALGRIEQAHKTMPLLLTAMGTGEHVYLYGPPGSGKSYAAIQAAQALQREYSFVSTCPQSPESKLQGFTDAMGKTIITEFRKRYCDGGVFVWEEADNAHPTLQVLLNVALENGHHAFPDGLFARHEAFQLVATGNTAGRGADRRFPERRAMDLAFSDRLLYIHWDYDTDLEHAICAAIDPDRASKWVPWFHKVRAISDRYRGLEVTPRSMRRAIKLMAAGVSVSDSLECALWRGIGSDTVSAVTREVGMPA